VLGLELLMCSEEDGFALFTAGAARLALKVGAHRAAERTISPGVLLAFEVDDLDAWMRRLQERGVAPDGPVKASPEGYRRARLRDPDGHAVSLFAWEREGG
jgi:hydroxymethylpyrimidine/phosphomethylpyrimidine kinase